MLAKQPQHADTLEICVRQRARGSMELCVHAVAQRFAIEFAASPRLPLQVETKKKPQPLLPLLSALSSAAARPRASVLTINTHRSSARARARLTAQRIRSAHLRSRIAQIITTLKRRRPQQHLYLRLRASARAHEASSHALLLSLEIDVTRKSCHMSSFLVSNGSRFVRARPLACWCACRHTTKTRTCAQGLE